MASDKLFNRTGAFGDSTLGDGDPVTPAYLAGVDENALMLGRSRWTSGATVLQQSDCEAGASQVQPGDRLFRYFRLSGTATADDATRLGLSTPVRGSWHSDDNSGAVPALDNRTVKGDSCQIDTGSGDTYVLHYDGSRFRGYGVLAEYRTAATATSGATQNQASERIAMRSSRWDTSGTPAAKDREWSFYCHTSSSAGDGYSLLHIDRRHEGGAWTGVATLDTNGWLYLTGAVPGIEINSGGAGNAYIRATATDPDGSVFQFAHGNSSRWARFRFMAATGGADGTAAEALGLRYGSEATGGTTLVKSPSATWWASAWDGVSAAVALGAYAQLVPTADDAGYLRYGFDFGSGVYQFHEYGLLGIAGSSTGGLLLSRYTAATNGSQLVDSSLLKFRGAYWNGAASADIDATTKLVTDATTPTAHLRSTFSSGVAIFDHYDDGAAVFHMDPAGASTYGGQLAIRPDTTSNASNPAIDSPAFSAVAYSGSLGAARVIGLYTQVDSSADASDQWSARFLAVGTGSAEVLGIRSTGELVVADIAGHALEFATALGTHNKTTNADKTGNAKSGTIKVKANGTTYHIQLYADA